MCTCFHRRFNKVSIPLHLHEVLLFLLVEFKERKKNTEHIFGYSKLYRRYIKQDYLLYVVLSSNSIAKHEQIWRSIVW